MKQNMVALARQFQHDIATTDSPEKELAAALLYMNLADYLAEFLVLGLDGLTQEALGKYYLGVIKTSPQRERLNLERSITALKQYQFPQREAVLKELQAIKKARNELAHRMFKTSPDQMAKMDQAEAELVAHTEQLVNIVDEISSGLPPRNLLEKLNAQPDAVQEEAEREVQENQSARQSK